MRSRIEMKVKRKKTHMCMMTILNMSNHDEEDTKQNDNKENAMRWCLCCEAAGERI